MSISRRRFIGLGAVAASTLVLGACARSEDGSVPAQGDDGEDGGTVQDETQQSAPEQQDGGAANTADPSGADASLGTFERGSQTRRGFEVDDMLRGTPAGDVHFSLHVPDSYDGSNAYALYVHCPGWEGLWFQGIGAHLVEDFAFVANDYVADMIVVTPQLDDWGETSAQKAIALTRWMLANYNIDPGRVYLSGYSGGGETISIVMGMHPELYRRALHLSSQWDGNTDVLVQSRVPVRLSIGESDDYYGSDPAKRAYTEIRGKYQAAGLSDGQIDDVLVLDVKPASYFSGYTGQGGQHAGGAVLFSQDPDIMGWLFQ